MAYLIKPVVLLMLSACFYDLLYYHSKHWPHQGGQRKRPAFGKQLRFGKRNHFVKYCKNKLEIKVVQGSKQLTDTLSDNRYEEFKCTLQEVNPMGQSDNKPLKTKLVSGVDIMVLPHSNATVNAMESDVERLMLRMTKTAPIADLEGKPVNS